MLNLLLAPLLLAASGDTLLTLTDATLNDALADHPLLLVAIGVEQCEPCRGIERMMLKAVPDLRAKAPQVKLAKLIITSQESPAVAAIVPRPAPVAARPARPAAADAFAGWPWSRAFSACATCSVSSSRSSSA